MVNEISSEKYFFPGEVLPNKRHKIIFLFFKYWGYIFVQKNPPTQYCGYISLTFETSYLRCNKIAT